VTRALPALALCVVLAVPAVAQADSCTFNAGTITASGSHNFVFKRVGNAIEVRSGTSAAVLACGAPTVTTVDTINVTATSAQNAFLTIDLSGGAFAPGASAEPGTANLTREIEFGVNLNARTDSSPCWAATPPRASPWAPARST
jgi:hypothetical protein